MEQLALLTFWLLAAVSCMGQPTQASVALESPARVGLPVWLKISAPDEIRYPFYTVPDWHECHDVEVRKDGKPFPRIRYPKGGIGMVVVVAGPACGIIFLPGKAVHPGSIPLHLMYRFEQPSSLRQASFRERSGCPHSGVAVDAD